MMLAADQTRNSSDRAPLLRAINSPPPLSPEYKQTSSFPNFRTLDICAKGFMLVLVEKGSRIPTSSKVNA
jgi:hypothetical protein